MGSSPPYRDRWRGCGVIVALLSFSFFLPSCLTPSPRELLLKNLEEYHRAIRWGREERAMSWVDPVKTADFQRWFEEWSASFEIQEWRIKTIQFLGEDRAEVEVERIGYRKDELKERRFPLHQLWRRVGERWVLEEGF
jgi:hypothetical protein